MGQILSMYKAAASGKPGVLSTIGLSTFVDPRLEGGKMNQKAIDSVSKRFSIINSMVRTISFIRASPSIYI